jgi:hypothetical protein
MLSSSSAKATARALRSAEQQIVADELRHFESTHLHGAVMPAKTRHASRSALSDSTDTAPLFSSQSASTTAAASQANATAAFTMRANRDANTQRLMETPFLGERSVLHEAQQVHDAVTWLRECPSSTLRQLQQRVLCATEALITQLVGMPAAARELLALSRDPNEAESRAGNDNDVQSLEAVASAYVTPPPSLTFTEFLCTFLRDTATTPSPAAFYGVLISGRPQPAAPLSPLHLIYGLHIVEDALRPAGTPAATGLEAHQALMSEVVHWASFFEHIFDKAHEGFCRDPLNFYVAVLLACAERGAWELHNTPEAIADEAVRRLRLDDGSSGRRPDICSACQMEATHLAEKCRTYVRHTLQTMQYTDSDTASATSAAKKSHRRRSPSHQRGGAGRGRAARSRFFLATPAVVWWAAAFLRFYRLRTPVAATTRITTSAAQAQASSVHLARGSAEDTVSTAEVYFIRDWIAQAAKMDEDGFAAQEREGGFAVPLSCATNASVAVFRFTKESVVTALRRISVWADAGVAASVPLSVQDLLTFLQDDFPVVPYYFSFFASS